MSSGEPDDESSRHALERGVTSYLEAGPRDAVEVQRLLDEHYESALRDSVARGLPYELFPQPYRLSSFEVTAHTRMQFRREAGLELVLVPLGLGASIRYEIAATSVLSLSAVVHAIPPHDGAS